MAKVVESEYVTRKEAANILRCNESTIYRWNKQGKFQRYGIGGKVLYKRSEIENCIVTIG